MQKLIRGILLLTLIISAVLFPLSTTSSAKTGTVYKVPVHNEVEKGLYAFLKRSFKEAEQSGADVIVLDINTPGGFTDTAGEIAKLMDETDTKIVAFVNKRALSAGAFLALHADEIYMAPNSTMGASAVIDGSGNAADTKARSAWSADMINAAESHQRDPKFALAMANPEEDLSEFRAGPGELLTLRDSEAVLPEVGYSEGTVANYDELLTKIGMKDSTTISTDPTLTEQIARFITNPVVVPILLSIAGLGLIVELYSPGFGVAGTMGLSALLLFFYGHLIAGLAGYETILLFIIGAGLIIAELFLPHGIAGILGAIAVTGSIILAGANPVYMAISVLIALVIATTGMVVIMKFFGKKLHLLNKVILMDATDTESGYVSNVNRIDWLGKTAVTLTALRPSGAIVMDGERIDVVSEGNYIDKGKHVKIVKVEGSRTVVRELQEMEGNE
ncbi:NfeD family protein [Sporosarcina aquimarina]|uniref:Nodulation protein NfeD n=1 Tax=Sporosarcina aquimarina TaxID=114975 RepID=A0ABU4FW89_9BACL|nr:nodulation protein NfeD [Sporosarcina aquimarina]MDW0108987.1 nodulation protein NfeD [Sporosarcina aquimarina]